MRRSEGVWLLASTVVPRVHARFLAFSTGARVRASCISLAHVDFITGCIVLDLLEMHFW
jgi:hypothetical protein